MTTTRLGWAYLHTQFHTHLNRGLPHATSLEFPSILSLTPTCVELPHEDAKGVHIGAPPRPVAKENLRGKVREQRGAGSSCHLVNRDLPPRLSEGAQGSILELDLNVEREGLKER